MAGHVENFDFIFPQGMVDFVAREKRKEEENVHVHREVVKSCALLCCVDL